MLKIPEKLFEIERKEFEIGISTIYFFEKNEIEKEQGGYRYDIVTGEPIEDWIGEEFIVVGNDSCCGDPIIAKIDEEELPIYSMFHDDWSTLTLVAESLEQYVNMLQEIDEINLANEEECDKFLERIKQEVSQEGYEYWENLVVSAFELFNEE